MEPEALLSQIPAAPGVYMMKDSKGTIFYIGKAKDLLARLRSYMTGQDNRAFVALLEHLLHDISIILTHTEQEALLLEREMIRIHKPRFNVRLTDDKRYLALKVRTSHPYPRIETTRTLSQDGARYFGPYTSANTVRQLLRFIHRIFPLRTCSDAIMVQRKRPCLQYQLKRCPAPCVYPVDPTQYRQTLQDAMDLLAGQHKSVVQSLTRRMDQAAQQMAFEQAARLRDQRAAVLKMGEKQHIISQDFLDRDVVGMYRKGTLIIIHLLLIRQGRLEHSQSFRLKPSEFPSEAILEDFLGKIYSERQDYPSEVILPMATAADEALSAFLSERRGSKVSLLVPHKGHRRQLLALAERNAAAQSSQHTDPEHREQALAQLAKALHLRQIPKVLVCCDISHHQGKQIVASMVQFVDGQPDRPNYRHYTIKSLQDQNDPAAIYEVVSRRLTRDVKEGTLPDLLVIDGGKSQLHAASRAMQDCGVEDLDVISLAKERQLAPPLVPRAKATPNHPDQDEPSHAPNLHPNRHPQDKKPERIYVLGTKDPFVLPPNSHGLMILAHARDEAHRFALRLHRRQKRSASQVSKLDGIAQLGPKRKRLLLRHFRTLAQIEQASCEQLQTVLGEQIGKAVFHHFHPPREQDTSLQAEHAGTDEK